LTLLRCCDAHDDILPSLALNEGGVHFTITWGILVDLRRNRRGKGLMM
jgi:hypothetical protein